MEPRPPELPYELDHLHEPLARATHDAWLSQVEELEEAEATAHASSYRLRARWALDYARGEAVSDKVYGLVPKNSDGHACALLELVHAPRIERLKLLNIYLEPRLDVLQPHQEEFRGVVTVLAHATLSAVGLIFRGLPAKEIKLYGRNEHMFALFDNLKEIFSGDDNPAPILEAARQGAWLVFTKTT